MLLRLLTSVLVMSEIDLRNISINCCVGIKLCHDAELSSSMSYTGRKSCKWIKSEYLFAMFVRKILEHKIDDVVAL